MPEPGRREILQQILGVEDTAGDGQPLRRVNSLTLHSFLPLSPARAPHWPNTKESRGHGFIPLNAVHKSDPGAQSRIQKSGEWVCRAKQRVSGTLDSVDFSSWWHTVRVGWRESAQLTFTRW